MKWEKEITRFELDRIFEGDEQGFGILMGYLHCRCEAKDRHLVGYTVHVNHLHDVILRGRCSHCAGPAARYLETGDDTDKVKRMDAILKHRKQGKG